MATAQQNNHEDLIQKLTGTVEHEASGKAGTYQIRKTGGSVEYVADQGTVYHPVTYMLIKKQGRGKGKVLLQDTPGRQSKGWLEAARSLVDGLANGDKVQTPVPVEPTAPVVEAKPVSDANPYDVISEEIKPTLEVISASKALLGAIERAGLQDEEIGQCVRKGLDTLRLKLADQLVERTSGGWFSAK